MRYQNLSVLIITLLIMPTLAQATENRGLEIAQETDRRDSHYGDYVVKGVMTLESPDGSTGERQFSMYTLEIENDGDKRLVYFEEPRDLAGMVSLTYSHGLEPDDQWIYLPALRRTKRLAARDKTGSFGGSEFSFEDISTWEVKKYTYKYLRDEDLEGKATFVIENTPAYPYSGYSRIKEWVDQEIYQPRRLLFFDVAGRPLKELRFYDYRLFLNRYWRPMKAVMTNLQTKSVSTIAWSNYQFRTGLDEKNLHPKLIRRWSK